MDGKPIFLPSVYTKHAQQPSSYDHAEDGKIQKQKRKKKEEEEAITERPHGVRWSLIYRKNLRAYPVNCSFSM